MIRGLLLFLFWTIVGIGLRTLWNLFREWRRTRPRRAEDSIVLLLSQPRAMNGQTLAALLASEFGMPVGLAEAENATAFVTGEAPILSFQINGGLFVLHVHAAPYVPNAERVAAGVAEQRLATAIREHRAWLSIDAIHGAKPYETIGRTLARLWGADVMALLHRPSKRMAPGCDLVPFQLRSDDPVRAVFGEIEHSPVVNADAEDAELAEAKRVAQRRWKEFCDAFASNSGNGFSVKAPITRDDRTEHIWVDVEEITPVGVWGLLGNEPLDLPGLRLGSRVEVLLDDVEDWSYLRDGKTIGGFSIAVLLKRKR
jgi:uncharacterized protein YegJ (DUF2314 family)